MKLIKIHIKKYQSIKDSNEFNVSDITCLVGKNEAGKTSILKALYKLNPIISTDSKFDDTDDYPRSEVEDYKHDIATGIIKPQIVVDAIFELEDEDIEELFEELGENVLSSNTLELSKGYDNVLHFRINCNEDEVYKHSINNAQLPPDTLKGLKSISGFNKASEYLKTVEQTNEVKKLLLAFNEIASKGLQTYIYEKYLEDYVPQFLYFDDYYQLTGQENIEQLVNREKSKALLPSDYPMLGLIDLARLNLQELLTPERTQGLLNKLEGASNHLTKQILKYWSQNKHLRMTFDVRPGRPKDPVNMQSGTNIWAQIYDQKRWVHTNLGTRSRGFVWFFSFLAWYSKIRKENCNVILLLDEPGLSLHAKAQADLLKYFEEELAPHHQLIYSTHSPFMVDSSKFSRVRIVQDLSIEADSDDIPAEKDGTKVFTDVLEATEDSLFPLQGALGYEIYQTLFVGPNSLVVEGVSDLLFIQAISGLLESEGRTSLSNSWTITPVGGSDKVPTFVALLGSQKGLKVATLIDIQKKDVQSIENLFKKRLLDKSHVLTFGDFSGKAESDIEDMFEDDFYLDMVNEEYKNQLTKKIKLTDLNNNIPRIIVRIEQYLEANPLKGGIKFNHFRPARFFNENLSKLSSNVTDETKKKFENAFLKLNNLLINK
jgi:predicted ATP-dependent endonuclease of OLD family